MIEKSDMFFGTFDLERVCLDKYFFVVYDARYCQGDHPFDDKLAQEFWQNKFKSRAKARGRFVDVIRYENDYSFFQMYLNKSRHMFCYVNIIKYLQAVKGITVDQRLVLSKDNFMPLDDKTLFTEYLQAKRDIENNYVGEYHKFVRDNWQVDLEEIAVKPVQLEIAYEIFPASVNDIANNFDAKEVTFKRYNTQSGTIYLNEHLGSTDIRLPDGLTMKITEDNEVFSDPPSAQYTSRLSAGYSTDKIQIKFYQKSFGLVRIEFSIVNDTIKKLNDPEDYIRFLHKIMTDNLHWREFIKRFDVSLEDIIKAVSKAVKITEEQCYAIKDIGIWESSRETRPVMQKLRNRGLLIPITDEIGTKKKGRYKVAPWFQEIFTKFKPKGKELFLPSVIKRR